MHLIRWLRENIAEEECFIRQRQVVAMATHFKILEQGKRRWLSVEGAWEPRLAKVMETHGLRDLRLLEIASTEKISIDFLRDVPNLERLGLCVNGPRDWTPLYDLSNLRVLELQCVTTKIDFTRMPRLEHIMCNWNARLFSSLCDCEWLTNLGLDHFGGPDFRMFKKLKALRNIGFAFTRLESFVAVEHFPELTRLSLGPVNHIETLDHLDACPKLRYVGIDNAKKLRRIDAVAHLRSLQELFFKACPNIESLRSLAGLPNLEYFGLLETTTVADGDLAVLKTLPKLKHASIRDRKHYTNNNRDFPKAYRTVTKMTKLYEE